MPVEAGESQQRCAHATRPQRRLALGLVQGFLFVLAYEASSIQDLTAILNRPCLRFYTVWSIKLMLFQTKRHNFKKKFCNSHERNKLEKLSLSKLSSQLHLISVIDQERSTK